MPRRAFADHAATLAAVFVGTEDVPVFALALDGERPYSVFDVSAGLREHDWRVRAYTFAAHREDLARCGSWSATVLPTTWPTRRPA